MKNYYAVTCALASGILLSGLLASTNQTMAEEKPDLVSATIAVPFAKLLCLANFAFDCTTSVGGNVTPVLPDSFTVPSVMVSGRAVKHLVISFVSGSCVGTGRTLKS